MKPEYQLKVEGLTNKEQVMSGLLSSGYILSCQKKFGDIYEISVYGKERVDGNGSKPSDWFEKTDKPSKPTPYIHPYTTPVPDKNPMWDTTKIWCGSMTQAADCTAIPDSIGVRTVIE